MLKHPVSKALTLYLVIAMFALSFPAQGWAMLVPAGTTGARSTDLAKVQSALESSVIKQRLLDYGLTAEEAAARISSLSDEQLHRLAASLDAVQAGGDAAGDVIVILLIIVIVIVILELTGHRVVVRK